MNNVAGSTRRSAILDSAVAEFSAHGYLGGRIERIAVAAGANKQLIFHYFGSKDGLYAAAVSTLLASATESLQEVGSTPPEALKGRISKLAGQFQLLPGVAIAITENSLGSDIPEAASRSVGAWLERQREAFRAIIEDGQRMGFFRDDIDAQSVADTSLASLIGWAVAARRGAWDGHSGGGSLAVIVQAVADYCAWR